MAEGKKFSGIRYYHRHAEGGNEPKAALNWREHRAQLAWQRRKRIAGLTFVVVLTGALVVITYVLLIG